MPLCLLHVDFPFQIKMEGLEDHLRKKEELEKARLQKLHENNATALEDAERYHDLEVKVRV